MYTWPIILGLIVAAILLMIPLIMIGQLVYNIVTSSAEQRRAEARRGSANLPGLGVFSTTDDLCWTGEVRGLLITFSCSDGVPTAIHASMIISTLDQILSLMSRAKAYLAEHEDMSWLEGGAAGFEPYGIDFETGANFVLESTHPSDPDGVYRVEFYNGIAVGSGRDD